jgi:hypothetical protein
MNNSHPLERKELMAYLDGELRPERAAAAATHMEHCTECRATAADLRELSQQLAAWEATARPMEMPSALRSAVDVHVAAQKKRIVDHRRSWRQILGTRRLIWEGAVCGILLLFIFARAVRAPLSEDQLYKLNKPNNANDKEVQARLEKAPEAGKSHIAFNAPLGQNIINTDVQTGFIVDMKELPPNAYETRIAPKGFASAGNGVEKPATLNGPMIVRTSQLSLIAKNFNQARARSEEILKSHGGYVSQLNVDAPENSGRTLTAVFRVPAAHLDAVLTELKKLGRVTSESQGGEEVTQQYVELEARLANARHTEQRLSDLLRDRTGKLSDVLAFEKEIDRVRGEIESMEAQRKSLAKQVDYATLNTTLSEEYGTPLQLTPPSTSMRFRNAAVEGYRALAGGIVGVLLFLLSTGPSLLVLAAILFFVGRLIWKRVRERIA